MSVDATLGAGTDSTLDPTAALARRREQAEGLDRLLPWPAHTVDEDWRRTDISRLHPERFERDGAGDPAAIAAAVAALRVQRDVAAPQAAFVATTEAGATVEGADMLTAQGAVVTTVAEAAVKHTELLLRALDTYAADENKLAALWHAQYRDGCFVYVPRGVRAATPVWVGHTVSQAGVAVTPATLVVLEDGAELELIEVFASATGEDEAFSNAASLLRVGANAELRYSTLQLWGEGVWHFARQRTALGDDARLRMFGASFGGRLQKAYWDVLLEGRGGDASINGLCFADGTQHFDHQSLQAHRAPSCRSDFLLKVAARDRGQSVYSGLIVVEAEAQKTDAYVQNRNLMLSHGARASSIPRLEIKANDVRCSHGTTSGHIDAEERFYLQARGVPADEADRIIVRGFMEDVLARAPHAGVRELISQLLDTEIGGVSAAGLPVSEVEDSEPAEPELLRSQTGEAVPSLPRNVA